MSSVSISSVGSLAYLEDLSLTSATIASGNIGEFAFYGCTSLTDVSFGSNVSGVLAYAFYGCSSLTTVVVPASVTRIGDCAFAGCTSLTDVYVLNASVTISKSAFAGSTVTVHYPNGTTKTGTAAGNGIVVSSGAFLDIDATTHVCTGFTTAYYDVPYPTPSILAIPTISLTSQEIIIGDGGFRGSSIQTLILPAGAKFDYGNTFEICTSLTSVVFHGPNTDLVIKDSTFGGCTSLTSVSLPEGLTAIEQNAFGECALTEITLPSTLTTIGASAFFGNQFVSLIIPRNVTAIGAAAFAQATPCTLVDVSYANIAGITGMYSITSSTHYTDNGDVLTAYAGYDDSDTFYNSYQHYGQGVFSQGIVPDGEGPTDRTPYFRSLMDASNNISNLSVDAIGTTTVALTWNAPAKVAPFTKYHVLINDEVVATLPYTTLTYTAASLNYATDYTFKVRVFVDGLPTLGADLTATYSTMGSSPTWWAAFTSNKTTLLNTLGARYAPRLSDMTQSLTYYLSNGGTFSGSFTEWETGWKAIITQDAAVPAKVNAAHVMLLNIYNQMLLSTDSATVASGTSKLAVKIPRVIDMTPGKPVVSCTTDSSRILVSISQPDYFWNCYSGYKVYLDGTLVSSDVSGSYYLHEDVSSGGHTVEVSAVNLLGVEGQKKSVAVTVSASSPAWLTDLIDSAYRAVIVNGSTAVGLNDLGTIATSSLSLGIRPRLLGGFSYQLQTPAIPSAPSSVAATTSGNRQMTVTWIPADTDYPVPSNYNITAVDASTGSSWVINTGSTALFYTITDLSAGSFYQFKVQTTNSVGSSAWSSLTTAIQATTTASAPLAPTLSTTGQGRLSIAWSAPTNTGGAEILSYTIELVDTINSANNQTASNILFAPYNLTGKTSSYKCRVLAVNANGAGELSDYSEIITPNALPDTVTDLSANVVSSQSTDVLLSWSAPSLNGGPTITGYEITCDGVATDIRSTETTYTFTNLSYGVAHTFTVKAKNVNGTCTTASNQISLTPYSVPGMPTLTFAVSYATGTATWTAPTYTGGYSISSYTIEVMQVVNKFYFAPYTTIADLSGTTYNISNLPAGSAFYARIAAHNALGQGSFSGWKNGGEATTEAVPSVPLNFRVTQESSPMTVEWNAPANTNGSALVGYQVKAYLGGAPQTFSLGPNTRAKAIPDVSYGNVFVAEVRGINAIGSSAPATIDASIIQNLIATATDDLELTVTWDAPEDNGFPAVESYVVNYRLDDESDPSGTTVSCTEPTITLTDLSAGSAWLQAYNNGNSTPDASLRNIPYIISVKTPLSTRNATVSAAPISAPGAVVNLSASQDASGYIQASWASPIAAYGDGTIVADGGSAIIAYLIDISSATDLYQVTVSGDVFAIPSQVYAPTLAGDYTVKVRAENMLAIGSTATTTVTVTTPPGAPSSLVSSQVSRSAASIGWTAPEYTGGSAITSYDIEVVKIMLDYSYEAYIGGYYTGDLSLAISTDVSSSSADVTSFTVYGLDIAYVYAVRVRAVTAIGYGEWSQSVGVQTFPDNDIVGVSAEQVGNNIYVSWAAPNNNIYGYYLAANCNESTVYRSPRLTTTEFSFPNTALPLIDGTYQFRVFARSNTDESGAWAFSNEVEYIAGPPPTLAALIVAPSTPVDVSASPVSSGSVQISWTPVVNPDSLPTVLYDIECVEVYADRMSLTPELYATQIQTWLTQLNDGSGNVGRLIETSVSGDAVSKTLTGVGGSYVYFIRMRAGSDTDGWWKSNWSDYIVYSLTDYEQDTITDVSASQANLYGRLYLKWALLSGKTNYRVEYTIVDSGMPYVSVGDMEIGASWTDANGIAMTGLTNGERYNYRVAGFNSYGVLVGEWAYSNNVTFVGPPRNVVVKTSAATELTVTWDAPSVNGEIVDSYRIYDGSYNEYAGASINNTSRTAVIGGLTAGTRYVIGVGSNSSTYGRGNGIPQFVYGIPINVTQTSNYVDTVLQEKTAAAPGATKDEVLENALVNINTAYESISDNEPIAKQNLIEYVATNRIGEKLTTLSSGSPTFATKITEVKNTFVTLGNGLPLAVQETMAAAAIAQINQSVVLTTAEKAVSILAAANTIATQSSEKKSAIIKSLAAVATFTAAPISLNAEQTSALVAAFGSVSSAPTTVDIVVPKKTVTTTLTSNESVYMPLELSTNYPIKYGTETVQVTYSILPAGQGQITVRRANNSTETYSVGQTVVIGGNSFRLFAVGGVGFQGGGNGGGGGGGGAICFFGNAPVLTPTGYKTMDSLRVGDYVQTADGRTVQIQRVCHQRIAASPQTNPYRIPKGYCGATQSVLISPDHRIAIEGRGMIEACRLGLQQLTREGVLDYYNLELPDWKKDNMVVGGVEVESLAPVRRIRVDRPTFMRLLRECYGDSLTTAGVAKILKKCVFHADGTVEAPFMRKA